MRSRLPSSDLSVAALLALPPTVDLATAGRAHGIGRSYTYRLAREDESALPFPVLRIGKRLRVTRAALLRSLGIDPDRMDSAA